MIYAIIQARMGSSRLPGKIMLDLAGRPVLWHVIDRVNYSKYVNKIVVATSIESKNDEVRHFCDKNSVLCFSGSEDDVLDRFYNAAINNSISDDDIIIRITADCPLIDPNIIDKTIERFLEVNADYASNTVIPTYPDGLDCEVMRFSALSKAWEDAKLKSEREHVTPYIRNHPELFKITSIENDEDISSLRWTLDEKEDYQLIKLIYDELYEENNIFLMDDILDFAKSNPNIKDINSRYQRNEGLIKSLLND